MNLQLFWYTLNPLIAKKKNTIPTQQMVHGRLFTTVLEVQPVCCPHSSLCPCDCPVITPAPVRTLRTLSYLFFGDQNRYSSSDLCLSYLTTAHCRISSHAQQQYRGGCSAHSFVLCNAMFTAITEENTALLFWCCDNPQKCVVIHLDSIHRME